VADIARLTAVTMGRSVCRQASLPAERADWGQSETSGSSAVPTAAKPLRSKYQSTSALHERILLVREVHLWTLEMIDVVWEP
jgi:hypothetical protein